MLDENKIRVMTRLSIYDKRRGEKDRRIAAYYRKDYASLNVWISLIWLTVGYVVLLVLAAAFFGTALLEGLTIRRLIFLIAAAAAIYVCLLIIYAVRLSSFYKQQHWRAVRNTRTYMRNLSRLERLDRKESDEQ